MYSGNKILIQKWNDHENIIMSNKIRNTRPIIKTNEPVSFKDFSKIHKKGETESFKDFCKRMNDLNLFKKLESIYTRPNTITNNKPRSLDRKFESNYAYKKKWKIAEIVKDNYSMLKRLKDSKSIYPQEKLENDFKKNQNCIKHMCKFSDIKDPSILKYTKSNFLNSESSFRRFGSFNNENNNFNNTIKTQSNQKISGSSFYNKDFKSRKIWDESTSKSKSKSRDRNIETNSDFNKTNYNKTDDNYMKSKISGKVVYSRKAYFNEMGLCDVTFIIEDGKFFISFNPISESDYNYTIVISNQVEIDRLAKMYNNYEHIIKDILFDGQSINFKPKVKKVIEYVSYFK